MTNFADTSFLTSLYTSDSHTTRAEAIFQSSTGAVLITSLVELELVNAIELGVFRKFITAHMAGQAHRTIEKDLRAGLIVVKPLSAAIFSEARRRSTRHTATLGARSFDLLHVASAVSLKAENFFSFDRNQRKLAEAAGLNLVPESI